MGTKGILTSHPFEAASRDPFRTQQYHFVDYTLDGGPDRSLHPGIDFGPWLFCFNTTASAVVGDVVATLPSTLTCPAHGLANGQQVRLDTDGLLPTGLLLGNYYFVVGATTDTFQVSLTSGGAAVIFTDVGTGHHVVVKRGTPFDFTGWTIWSWVKATPNDPDANKLLDLAPTFVVPNTLGTVQIQVPHTGTELLASANAFWDMVAAGPSGTRYGALVEGQFNISKLVTHP